MNSDIVQLRAKLADKKRSFTELNLRAESHVMELRNILDPYIDDYTTLRMNIGRAEWQALDQLYTEMTELKRQIDKMEKDLNHG